MTRLVKNCRKCNSKNLVSNLMPSTSQHYAKLICGDCGRYIQWIGNPTNTAIAETRTLAIQEILSLHFDSLSQWEIDFLGDIKNIRTLSDRQSAKLDHITERVLGFALVPALKELAIANKLTPCLMVGVVSDG